MIMSGTISPEAVKELLTAMDSEIALLEERHSQFQQLYQAIIQRDDRRMESIFAQMTQIEARQEQTDRIIQLLRRRLAAELPCGAEEFRLSLLAAELGDDDRHELEGRRERIMALVKEVRREHLRTSMLLAECARINRLLLGELFPGQESCVTYGAGGSDVWKGSSALLDTER
jgi:hypothetical protein